MVMDPHRTRFKYASGFCEENVWHLCGESIFEGIEVKVVFVLSQGGICRLWNQKICGDSDDPVC